MEGAGKWLLILANSQNGRLENNAKEVHKIQKGVGLLRNDKRNRLSTVSAAGSCCG